MIDAETRSQIAQIVHEAVRAVQAQGDSLHLQTLVDELGRTLSTSNGEHPYGEHPYGACESSPPGNFEPEFRNGSLYDVGEGFYPVGRRFYNTVTVDSSARASTATCIWLEVTYPSGSSGLPSAMVKGDQSFPNAHDVTDSVSWMPLYRINGGAIVTDFRSAMSLTMREL